MPTARRMRFVRWQLAWMVAAILGLSALGSLSLDLFFVVSLIGFLVVAELTAPLNLALEWRSRLRWIAALGVLGFLLVVVRRLIDVLPTEAIPW